MYESTVYERYARTQVYKKRMMPPPYHNYQALLQLINLNSLSPSTCWNYSTQ